MYPGPIHLLMNTRTNGQVVSDSFISRFDAPFQIQKFDDFSASAMDKYLFENPGNVNPPRIGSYHFESFDENTNRYVYNVFINTTAKEAAPFQLNQMNQRLISHASNREIQIKTTVNPLPVPKTLASFESTADSFISVLSFTLGLCLIPTSLIGYIVREKIQKVKQQQIVSGTGYFVYWLSNFIIDVLKLMIPIIISILLIAAFQIDSLHDDGAYDAVWRLFVLFGLCTIVLTYLMSFLFNDIGQAQGTTFVFLFVSGFLGGLALWIFEIFEDTRDPSRHAAKVFRIIPSVAFSLGLMKLSK